MIFNVYQPFLDYDFVPNPAVVFPTVVANYAWEHFLPIAGDYYRGLKDYMLAENEGRRSFYGFSDQRAFSFVREPVDRGRGHPGNPRGAGRKPTDFMALFKSFVCARYMDIEVNSRTICSLLNSNPAFLERMNFEEGRPPSYRVIDRFDQIMTEWGIWEKAAYLVIQINIQEKIIDPEKECFLIVDTTHVPARAKKGKVIKPCRECLFVKDCQWKVPTDDNAGVLVKSQTERYFAHKVGLSTLGRSSLPIDWFVDRGERYDGKFLEPLLGRFVERYPQFPISHVIGNGTFGSKENERLVREKLKAQLVAPVNPRRCQEVENPARGIKKITKHGRPVCIAGFDMVLHTRSLKSKEYIWVCAKYHPESPEYEPDFICDLRDHCSPGKFGRAFRTKAKDFPQINWDFPQFSKEAQGLLALRTTIERDVSLLKEGLKMESLWKRGKKNVIAHVAKCLLSMHLVAHVAHKVGRPNDRHKLRSFSV